MIKMVFKRIAYLLLAVGLAGLLASCSAMSTTAENESRQNYYDQYMDYPGQYEFGRPVVFIPGDDSDY